MSAYLKQPHGKETMNMTAHAVLWTIFVVILAPASAHSASAPRQAQKSAVKQSNPPARQGWFTRKLKERKKGKAVLNGLKNDLREKTTKLTQHQQSLSNAELDLRGAIARQNRASAAAERNPTARLLARKEAAVGEQNRAQITVTQFRASVSSAEAARKAADEKYRARKKKSWKDLIKWETMDRLSESARRRADLKVANQSVADPAPGAAPQPPPPAGSPPPLPSGSPPPRTAAVSLQPPRKPRVGDRGNRYKSSRPGTGAAGGNR